MNQNLSSDHCGPQRESRQMKRDRLEEGKNTLTQWGGMQKAQMTKELEEDLQVLKLRKWLNPKAMYKKEGKKMAKYFQVNFGF